jgi:aminobenzoyl-glutamate utilization protein B
MPHRLAIAAVGVISATLVVTAQTPPPKAPAPAIPAAAPAAARLDALKREAAADVEARRVSTQQMVDQVFSFGELGFQEVETSKYLTGVLEQNGFTVQRGITGMPTATRRKFPR